MLLWSGLPQISACSRICRQQARGKDKHPVNWCFKDQPQLPIVSLSRNQHQLKSTTSLGRLSRSWSPNPFFYYYFFCIQIIEPKTLMKWWQKWNWSWKCSQESSSCSLWYWTVYFSLWDILLNTINFTSAAPGTCPVGSVWTWGNSDSLQSLLQPLIHWIPALARV